MTQQPSPQQRKTCDSCNHAEKTNSRSYPVKCLISKPVPMMVHEYCISWFGYVGCLSHSAIQQEPGQQEYRITDETRKKMLRLWSIVQTHISYEQDTFYNLLDQAVQDAYQLDEVIRSRPVQSEQQQTASLKDATGKVPGGKQE